MFIMHDPLYPMPEVHLSFHFIIILSYFPSFLTYFDIVYLSQSNKMHEGYTTLIVDPLAY